MEHCVWAAGELILKHDVPCPDQSNGVGEGGGAALGETADVVTPGGPYRPTYRKKKSHHVPVLTVDLEILITAML